MLEKQQKIVSWITQDTFYEWLPKDASSQQMHLEIQWTQIRRNIYDRLMDEMG